MWPCLFINTHQSCFYSLTWRNNLCRYAYLSWSARRAEASSSVLVSIQIMHILTVISRCISLGIYWILMIKDNLAFLTPHLPPCSNTNMVISQFLVRQIFNVFCYHLFNKNLLSTNTVSGPVLGTRKQQETERTKSLPSESLLVRMSDNIKQTRKTYSMCLKPECIKNSYSSRTKRPATQFKNRQRTWTDISSKNTYKRPKSILKRSKLLDTS